jgi:hypothetical protein
MSHSPLRRLFPTFQADLSTNRQTRRQLSLRLTDIRGLLDKLDSFMLSVNEV